MASRFFAMMCHSWIYQSRVSNKALSIFEMVQALFRNDHLAQRALQQAVKQYRVHRDSMGKLAQG
jgi:hypothetical protein